MALHAKLYVPDGTTDELLTRAYHECLVALDSSIAKYQNLMRDRDPNDHEFWLQRYDAAKNAYKLLLNSTHTNLIP